MRLLKLNIYSKCTDLSTNYSFIGRNNVAISYQSISFYGRKFTLIVNIVWKIPGSVLRAGAATKCILA
jgi:hypothetical protein